MSQSVKNIFVNLPVKDLAKSVEFFTALGFAFNPAFGDESAACVVLGENIFSMITQEERFQGYAPHPISDAHQVTEVLTALGLDSKGDVNALVERAVAAGGKITREDQGLDFMFSRAFADLDGHIWEIFWIDSGTVQ